MARYNRPNTPMDDLLDEIDLQKVKRIVLVGLPILVLLVALSTSFYTVGPEGQTVIKRFGKVVGTQDPGLHMKLPFWIDRTYFVPTLRILKEEFGFRTLRADQQTVYDPTGDFGDESLMLTGDLNIIDVDWVVQYRIIDPDAYLHRLRNPTETIRVVSEAVMRRIVGNRMGSNVLTVGRTEISGLAKIQMEEILNDYGIGVEINAVELKDVTPPKPVQNSYNEVNVAEQERERLINEAEKERNRRVPRARGEAQKLISEAEAYEANRVNRAKGEADRFTSIYEEYKGHREVTRQRLYLEMIDTVLPRLGRLYVMEEGQMSPLPLLHLPQAETPPASGRASP